MAKRRKASAATRRRLKALRRKHGIGEFRKAKRRISRPKARARKISRPKRIKMAKKKYSRSKSRSFMSNPAVKAGIGAGLYAVAEPTLNNMAARVGLNMSDDFAKLAIGGIATQAKNSYIKAAGQAAIVLAVSRLVGSRLAGAIAPAPSTSSSGGLLLVSN